MAEAPVERLRWPRPVCPKCGGAVELVSGVVLDCYPPIEPLRCVTCGHEFHAVWDPPFSPPPTETT